MKIMFVSLGCDKNLSDSEMMLGILAGKGYMFTDDEQEADAFVVNTCCFIHDAKEESIQTLLELARYKERGRCRALIATGCLAQRYAKEIREEIPEVDAIVGTASFDRIAEAIDAALLKPKETPVFLDSLERLPVPKTKRVVTTGGYYAYLKIAEGCDKHCTYCVIPSIRGNYRSVPMEELLRQARELACQGVRELILVAQETTVYGTDLYGEKRLAQLLRELAKIPQIVWLRVLYCYPEEITPELVQVMKEEPKVCHYVDMPIQHCNDLILKRMGRRTDKAQLLDKIAYLRQEIPDITLRTTLITGFPGETKEDFEELKQFVDMVMFERLGVFTYSPEENTPAAAMEGQIPEEVRQERRDILMELQQEIAIANGEEQIGRELTVLIEGKLAEENAYVGRTYMDAPDVDGYIFVQSQEELFSGDVVRVRVTGAMDYDLIGEQVNGKYERNEVINEFTE